MVISDYTGKNPQYQSAPVTGKPERLPLCEICGKSHPQPVNVLNRGTLQLCAGCRRIFGFAGVEND